MRILLVSAEYPPETGWGGIGSYVACSAPALMRRGHQVHVLSCVRGQAWNDYLDDGVRVHRRGLVPIKGVGRLLPHTIHRFRVGLSAFVAARRLRVPFDIVEYPDWDAEGWMFALVRDKPTVAHLHGPLSTATRHVSVRKSDWRLASLLERLSVRRADAVTSPSAMLAEKLSADGWRERSQIDVVPYAVDWQRWVGTPPPSQAPPLVQYVGRLQPRKAPEVLIDAIAILRREIPHAAARFAGECLAELYTGTAVAPWSPRPGVDGCSFIGHVPRSRLKDFLASCRVFAQPSLFENFSMAALEAMAAGRPVVVTSTSGVAKFVQETRSGEVVPPRDPGALAEAIRPFLVHPSYADQVGERVRHAVARELDPDRIAEFRERTYARAVKSFGGAVEAARGLSQTLEENPNVVLSHDDGRPDA